MLLTVTSTAAPATDLGFLLHKHPGKVQSFDLAVGTAHVFYPEATEERCTAALLLEVDPIALVRGRPGADPRGGPPSASPSTSTTAPTRRRPCWLSPWEGSSAPQSPAAVKHVRSCRRSPSP